jgi:hypothetical protein
MSPPTPRARVRGPPTPSPSFEAWGVRRSPHPPHAWPTPYPSFGGTPSESKKFQFEIECDKSNMPINRGVSRMPPMRNSVALHGRNTALLFQSPFGPALLVTQDAFRTLPIRAFEWNHWKRSFGRAGTGTGATAMWPESPGLGRTKGRTSTCRRCSRYCGRLPKECRSTSHEGLNRPTAPALQPAKKGIASKTSIVQQRGRDHGKGELPSLLRGRSLTPIRTSQSLHGARCFFGARREITSPLRAARLSGHRSGFSRCLPVRPLCPSRDGGAASKGRLMRRVS